MTTPFKDIVSEAMTENVEAEVPQETSEAKPDAQVEQTEEPQQETFAEKPELIGRTPEQLEEIYQNWQKAYTAKRQKETQELKEYQTKLAELEQRSTQAPVQQTANVEQLEQQAREQVELGQMSVSQYTEYMKTLMAEQAREVAREEYQTLIAQQREDQLMEKAQEQFSSADSRLNEHAPDFDETFRDEVQRELSEKLDAHLAEKGSYTGFDAHALTKEIVARRDAQLDELIKKRTIQSTQAAKMRDAKARKSEVRGSTNDGQSIGGDSFRSILSETLDSAA